MQDHRYQENTFLGQGALNWRVLYQGQFYDGINGQCTAVWEGIQSDVIPFPVCWTRIFKEIADALLYLHSKSFLHNDIKGDNMNILLTRDVNQEYGKSRKMKNAKQYKLKASEKHSYFKEHSHIAPISQLRELTDISFKCLFVWLFNETLLQSSLS